MAQSVDQLIVEIKAETAGLRKGLDAVNKKLKKSNATAKASVLTFGNLAKVFAVIGFARLGGEIVSTARVFEDLNATLKAVTGTAEGAALSMKVIEEFTSGTTFQLENVSQAFITLMNAGITPTTEVLKDFGNIAAAFGKDISTMAQAVFNATTGETEMLKQFGIKAKMEGDKITMIFREQSTTIGKNSAEIVGYLRGIAQENYATALEERLDTVSGSFSNLKDMISLVFRGIGEAGLSDALKSTTQTLIKMTQEGIEPMAKLGAILGVVIRMLGKVFQALGTVILGVVAHLEIFVALLVGLAASAAVPALASIVLAFQKIRTAIAASSAAAIFFQSVTLGPIGIAKVTAGVIAAGAAYTAMKIELEKLTEEQEENTEAINFATMSQQAMDEELKKITESMKGAAQAAEEVSVTLGSELRQAVISTSSAFSKNFTDSLLEGKDALESFKNFAKNIVSQIISTFLQMAIVNQILNAVFGLTGGAALPTFTIPQSAGGGTVQKGKPVLVGERGAEIFVPNTGGTVMNNMNSNNAAGGGGGITVVQNNNFALGVGATARAEVRKMLPQIAETSKMAVFEAAARGGAYRKGLLGGT